MASPSVSSSSRLVSKLCVHGRVPAASSTGTTRSDAATGAALGPDDGGVRIDLLCKVNIPLVGGSQSYPLFPDRRVRLLSSSTYPLSQHASLVLTPPPPASILEAARHLRIGTTFDRPSATSSSTGPTTRAQPVVKVAVQDFAICLLAEGGGSSSSSEAGHKARGKSDAFSPTPQGVGSDVAAESAPWIVVLELFVPWLSVPPLDRTAIIIPLPRCLSNTLSLHLLLPPQDSDAAEAEEYSFMTSPKLLSSGTASLEEQDASPDDLVLAGTFQSTPQLEIRWRPALQSSTEGATIPSQALLRELRQSVEWTIGSAETEPVRNGSSAEKVVLGLKAQFEGDLHYAGVESVAYIDAELSFPASAPQPIEWLSPPVFKADRALASFQPATPPSFESAAPVDVDASFDTSISTVQSPSPTQARTKPLSQQSSLSSFSRTTSGGSSSQSSSLPSLLRQQLPSAHLPPAADLTVVDISFAAFDSSTQTVSPGASPGLRHRSPVGQSTSSTASGSGRRRKGASESEARTSPAWRIGVEVSKVHEIEGRWRVEWTGELRVPVEESGRVVLPSIGLRQEDDSAEASQVSIKAPGGWDVIPPMNASRSGHSSSKLKTWTVSPSPETGDQASSHFVLNRPSSLPPADTSPRDVGAGSASPRRTTPLTMRHRRRASSLVSTFSPLPVGPVAGPSSFAPVPDSQFWDSSAESLPQVVVETLLLPLQESVQQVTRMTIGLPLPLPSPDELGEDDTFEFGIVASLAESGPLLVVPPTVQILSATLNSLPVEWDLQLPSGGDEEPAIPGALGYVQLRATGLRAIGGEVCVRFVVDHPRPQRKPRWGDWRGKEREQALVVGLPSFEESVAWLDTRIETVEGMTVDLAASTSALEPLSRSTLASPLRLVGHSLASLATPVLSVALRPTRPPLPARSSSLSWAALASLLLLFWLLASVGIEVREVKDRLACLGLSVRQLAEERAPATTAGTTTRWADPMRDTPTTASSFTDPVTPSSSSGEGDGLTSAEPEAGGTLASSSILRPTFTSILPPPPQPTPPPVLLNAESEALGRPLSFYFPVELVNILGRADDVLESTAVGRGLRSVLAGLGRAIAWVVFG